jgi:hypothetical protein
VVRVNDHRGRVEGGQGAMIVDIKGIDKAALLAALYNGTSALGMGALHDIGHMTEEQARDIVRFGLRFDYVAGRPIKANIGGDTFETAVYDRDAGEGAAARIVASLRADEG